MFRILRDAIHARPAIRAAVKLIAKLDLWHKGLSWTQRVLRKPKFNADVTLWRTGREYSSEIGPVSDVVFRAIVNVWK